MKKNLLKGMMSMAFAMFAMGAFAQETVTVQPTADTWIRLNNKTNQAASNNMEMQTYTNADDATKSQSMLGLMSFEVPAEALASDATITKATLRLVTKRLKGDREVAIYKYTTFEENTIYEKEADNVATFMVDDNLIKTFKAEGKANTDITQNALGDCVTAAKWTNNIDVTEAIKELTDAKWSILLKKVMNQSNSTQFFTKEVIDFANQVDETVTFKAEDLIPQLTIVYEKSSANGISEVKTEANASSDAIYNLQGVRMNGNNLPAGIYVKNGKKFIVK